MTMKEIVSLLMLQADKYAIETEQALPGENGEMVMKKVKKIEVTISLIIDFCRENSLPLPEELLNMGIKEEGDSIV